MEGITRPSSSFIRPLGALKDPRWAYRDLWGLVKSHEAGIITNKPEVDIFSHSQKSKVKSQKSKVKSKVKSQVKSQKLLLTFDF